VACVRIQKDRGVCGAAWDKDSTQLVPDVHAFPGHIACDAASRSEIVIPIHQNGEVVAVLDIDSPHHARFTQEDQLAMEEIARTIESVL
jgi:GAF domain-containing protein